MNKFWFTFLFLHIFFFSDLLAQVSQSINLDGKWDYGEGRTYTKSVFVPGIAGDPTKINDSAIWYRRKVVLPGGHWKSAILKFYGARFCPSVYINGNLIGQQNGGMAPLSFLLKHPDIKPGKVITLEVSLKSLNDVKVTDPSYIPKVDHWRSNISSYLWDDVVLETNGGVRIKRVVPFSSIAKDEVTVLCETENFLKKLPSAMIMCGELIDSRGETVASAQVKANNSTIHLTIPFHGKVGQWSPEQPVLYKLRLTLKDKKEILDTKTISYGLKEFTVNKLRFYLNGHPYQVRANTVVWHRWTRDHEAESLAWDTAWFVKNVIRNMKERGANTIRFHLGTPPERILNLCDQYGLLVQYEWCFFHGMPSNVNDLEEQWRPWLDRGIVHPSVSLIHPYNETEGDQLKTAWLALDKILPDYPSLVVEDRDVVHIHKYWWSLFENVGIYYDDASQFPKAIMVDEFGGNYLNGQLKTGRAATIKESFWRFLGPDPTPDQLLQLHTLSNSKIAEYWRRIGAAGFGPFCSIGSSPDGDHWFLGDIKNGKLKPVWNAMAAAWSPVSVSLDVWDRDYIPGQKVELPVYFFNDSKEEKIIKAEVGIKQLPDKQLVSVVVPAYSKTVKTVSITLPDSVGDYTFEADLKTLPEEVKVPVVSAWDFRILKAKVPEKVLKSKVLVFSDEMELKDFLRDHRIPFRECQNINQIAPSDKSFDIILTSLKSWKKIENVDSVRLFIQASVKAGKSAVILDAGPCFLGQGYPEISGDLGPLTGVVKKPYSKIKKVDLFPDVAVEFREVAEPESFIHPTTGNCQLWNNLKTDYAWMWNGMRGGLVVPATGMEIEAPSSDAFINLWKIRGADEKMIMGGTAYFGYEFEGFYDFSISGNDPKVKSSLYHKIKLIAEDGPSLAKSINLNAPVKVVNLSERYNELLKQNTGISYTPLACCGKGLTRIPCGLVDFGGKGGKVIISQLLTSGRLAKGYGQNGLYGIRYDESAVQMVINMLNIVK
ncbi:MAG: glycoside hydrolase [Bacteroidota bacterium]|nr:glycoside hydrolase [Bacteroidota bacterium]